MKYNGRLVWTELTRISLPPRDKECPFQAASLLSIRLRKGMPIRLRIGMPIRFREGGMFKRKSEISERETPNIAV